MTTKPKSLPKTITKTFLGLALLAFGILLAASFLWGRLDPADSCLDHGGCWDKVANTCRQSEPNAQELCSRTK